MGEKKKFMQNIRKGRGILFDLGLWRLGDLCYVSGKWRMPQTNCVSGGFCQRDYDQLDEQVRTLLFRF